MQCFVWEDQWIPGLADYPWTKKKKNGWIVLNLKKPYLGFCLGCQLLGEVIGGKVVKSEPSEIGILDVNFIQNGKNENIFSSFPKQIKSLQWHSYEVKNLKIIKMLH